MLLALNCSSVRKHCPWKHKEGLLCWKDGNFGRYSLDLINSDCRSLILAPAVRMHFCMKRGLWICLPSHMANMDRRKDYIGQNCFKQTSIFLCAYSLPLFYCLYVYCLISLISLSVMFCTNKVWLISNIFLIAAPLHQKEKFKIS